MTKTLKRRFIIFTMMAVTGLLVFIVLAINSLNWMMLERQSDMVLETLMDADGIFQQMDFNRPPPFSRPPPRLPGEKAPAGSLRSHRFRRKR